MSVDDRIKALRKEMKKEGVDIYYVPTSDFHETEYVGEHFKCRQFITGFTGSAGVAIITADEAGLWTDGRYYIQAERELAGSCVTLYKAGMEGVIKPDEFIKDHVSAGSVLGFDGRCVNARFAEKLKKNLAEKGASLKTDEDLVGRIWTERPSLTFRPAYDWPLKYAGKGRDEKLAFIRGKMKEAGCDVHILSALDNICWLLNLRGNDIKHFPVLQSFLLMDMEKVTLFAGKGAIGSELEDILKKSNISVKEYSDVYGDVLKLSEGCSVLLDKNKVNQKIVSCIPKECIIKDAQNPEVLPQSVKNETEIENIRKAHIKDGAAVFEFMYLLKNKIGKEKLTEKDAEKIIDGLRAEKEGFMDLSFDTISAYGENAACMHYSAAEEGSAYLKPEGFLLVDSGAHYLEGTTDITRTYALGSLSEKEKRFYTAVLIGCLRLADAKFLYGCKGINLDILARGPVWDMCADYRCGTGHGVGYCLNVHEAPNGFRWRIVSERNDSGVLEAGQITSDEPGYYEDGAFGIRIENEILCKEIEKNEYGTFMGFETITYAPIDLEPVVTDMLSKDDIRRINDYHKLVYEKLSPLFEGEKLEYLRKVCKAI